MSSDVVVITVTWWQLWGTFYRDPSQGRPMYSALVRLLLRDGGFFVAAYSIVGSHGDRIAVPGTSYFMYGIRMLLVVLDS